MKRRYFLKRTSVGTTALLGCFPASLTTLAREIRGGTLERRPLGKTGEKLSILGFGGIVVMDATPREAEQRVSKAIDYGVNYFDVAPSYGDAEIKLGPALEPYRDQVFLACKTTERKKEGAARELEQSLKRLRTDHFDLYQLHAMTTLEDVDAVFAADGAMQAFLEARQAGKVRFLGFSAHSVEAAMALMDRFAFDSILFPVNFATWHAGNFGPQVLEKALSHRMGILALKAMAHQPWPKDEHNKTAKCWYQPLTKPEDAMMGLRFTLSHPVTAAIPPGNETLFEMALGLALQFTPLSAEEAKAIKTRGLAASPIFRHPTG
ncbi:MAG: aldo/keto reductase [Verrucomicrobia bacterium]|nr:aldo/keto reductase [Verrucomicrobiota bacterium]